MGIDWEKPFKRYIAKKFKERMGIELPLDAIGEIVMDFDIDYSTLDLHDLGILYSLAITTENFETAEKILKEFKKRDCTVKLNVNEDERTGTVDIYVNPMKTGYTHAPKLENVQISLIVTPEGVMIDWEKENF